MTYVQRFNIIILLIEKFRSFNIENSEVELSEQWSDESAPRMPLFSELFSLWSQLPNLHTLIVNLDDRKNKDEDDELEEEEEEEEKGYCIQRTWLADPKNKNATVHPPAVWLPSVRHLSLHSCYVYLWIHCPNLETIQGPRAYWHHFAEYRIGNLLINAEDMPSWPTVTSLGITSPLANGKYPHSI